MLGHWVDSLEFFIQKSDSESFKFFGRAISYLVPNLEKFNWRSAPVYGTTIDGAEILAGSASMLGWVLVLISATVLIFRRRDFV